MAKVGGAEPGWVDPSKETGRLVAEADLHWSLVCDTCRVRVLAHCTDAFKPRLVARGKDHQTAFPGHETGVVPRG